MVVSGDNASMDTTQPTNAVPDTSLDRLAAVDPAEAPAVAERLAAELSAELETPFEPKAEH